MQQLVHNPTLDRQTAVQGPEHAGLQTLSLTPPCHTTRPRRVARGSRGGTHPPLQRALQQLLRARAHSAQLPPRRARPPRARAGQQRLGQLQLRPAALVQTPLAHQQGRHILRGRARRHPS